MASRAEPGADGLGFRNAEPDVTGKSFLPVLAGQARRIIELVRVRQAVVGPRFLVGILDLAGQGEGRAVPDSGRCGAAEGRQGLTDGTE